MIETNATAGKIDDEISQNCTKYVKTKYVKYIIYFKNHGEKKIILLLKF